MISININITMHINEYGSPSRPLEVTNEEGGLLITVQIQSIQKLQLAICILIECELSL